VEVVAAAMVLMPLLDHDAAAHDPVIEFVEPFRMLADLALQRRRSIEVAERDL
jgi:hypothetical protein